MAPGQMTSSDVVLETGSQKAGKLMHSCCVTGCSARSCERKSQERTLFPDKLWQGLQTTVNRVVRPSPCLMFQTAVNLERVASVLVPLGLKERNRAEESLSFRGISLGSVPREPTAYQCPT